MDPLSTALHELSERREPVDALDAEELWARGRRRVRRRRALAAAAAVCVLGAASLGVTVLPHTPAASPAGQTHGPAFPEAIFLPDPDLPGTADDGPIGPLALVAAAPRGTSDASGLFGVSATTGDYRFLDLPDRAPGTEVALSPDGRHVGYYVTGAVDRPELREGEKKPVVGVALYDTVTGKVTRSEIPSDHGLEAAELFWADDDQMLFVYHLRTTTRALQDGGSYLWGPRMPAPVPSTLPDGPVQFWRNPDGSFIQGSTGTSFYEVVAGTGSGLGTAVPPFPLSLPTRPTATSSDTVRYDAVYRTGDVVVAVPDNTSAYARPLMVGPVGRITSTAAGQPVGPLRFLDKLSDAHVLGWKDDHTVLLTGFRFAGGRTGLYEADVLAGTSRYLGTARGALYSTPELPEGPSVAAELTTRTVPGRDPGTGGTPTAIYVGATGAVVLLAAGGLVLLFRRSRVQG